MAICSSFSNGIIEKFDVEYLIFTGLLIIAYSHPFSKCHWFFDFLQRADPCSASKRWCFGLLQSICKVVIIFGYCFPSCLLALSISRCWSEKLAVRWTSARRASAVGINWKVSAPSVQKHRLIRVDEEALRENGHSIWNILNVMLERRHALNWNFFGFVEHPPPSLF